MQIIYPSKESLEQVKRVSQKLSNVLGVLVVIWFIPWIARLLERLIPDGKNCNTKAEANWCGLVQGIYARDLLFECGCYHL
ncbi:MAG: hypothetical protein KME30_14675 [Iphinoe sp. HA4291-MV1]|jgi:Na+/phosphate symporter|nr:hypothetical protein [Iphinoe sp. HA4291-MV1]